MAGDTAALVVALSAQLTKFEKDMKQAGVIADREVSRIEDRFSKMNPGLATGIGSFLGTLGGSLLSNAIKELDTLYDRFKKIDETAKLAAISLNDVFGFQSAAPGAGFAEVDKALVSLSSLLDRAKRGEDNSLSTILTVNGLAVGSLKDAGEALFKVSNIVSRLTPIQGLEVLQKLGIPSSLLDDLRKGEEHLREIQSTASKAAPDLQSLADKAREFDKLWEAAAKGLKGYLASAFESGMESTRQFMKNTASELRALDKLFGGDGTSLLGRAAGELEANSGSGDGAPTPKRINIFTPPPAKPFPVNNPGGGAPDGDKFDRATDSLNKRLAGLQAEANAIDLGTAARERARVAAELETVAKQANAAAGLGANVITAQQRIEIDALAASFGKVAEQIERATSPLATFARESKNVEKQMNQFGASSLDGLTNSLADIVTGAKSAAEAFRALTNQIISDLARIAIRQAITGPIAGALMGSFGGGAGAGSIFGGARASGGPVEAGKAYVVGENRPELFVPRQSGVILPRIPSAQSGGSTFAPVYQINAAGADSGTVARIQAVLSQHAKAIQGQGRAMQGAQHMQSTGVGR